MTTARCKYCGQEIIWMIAGKKRIPVQWSSVNKRNTRMSRIPHDPIYNPNVHELHFSYCRKRDEEETDYFPVESKRVQAARELEIQPTASAEVVKAAYRALCLKHHPDRNQQASTEKMQKLNEAYEILSS